MKTVAGSCLIGVKKEAGSVSHFFKGLFEVCKYRKFNCDVTINVAKCGNLSAKENLKNSYNKNYTSQLFSCCCS